MDAAQYGSLTQMEREVLRRLGHGSRPGEIASQRNRSVSTVNNHLHAARAKLSVSDSISAARGLLAFERAGQNVPRHPLPIDVDPQPEPDGTSQPVEARPSAKLREERAVFEHDPSVDPNRSGRSEGGRHAATNAGLRQVGIILVLTLLLLACISLAPAMGETFQLVIDRIYPLGN